MNKIERIYRMRRALLIWCFACSVFLFVFLCYPKPPFSKTFPWSYFSDPIRVIFEVGGAILLVLFLLLLVRYVLFRASTLRDPALRRAVDDERIRLHWLRAYRLAFFSLLLIQLASKVPIVIMKWPLDPPFQSHFSISAAAMTYLGAFLYYSRERAHD